MDGTYEQKYKNSQFYSSNEYGIEGWDCPRRDDKNLVEDWLQNRGQNAAFVDNLEDLLNVDTKDTKHLLGNIKTQYFRKILF